MKGKFFKGIIAALLLCCISVPLSGCAFVGVDFRENVEGWWDDFWGNEDPDEDDSTNSGNEDESTGGSSTENTTFESSGDIYFDHKNGITVKPMKTTVTVGETFSIVVTKEATCTIEDEAIFAIPAGNHSEYLSVDESGAVTALKAGSALVGVTIGTMFYAVEVTVVLEETPDDTYVLSAVHRYENQTITISHHEVVMKTGESFTVEATDSNSTETPTVTVEGVAVDSSLYVSIDGATVKATAKGTAGLIVRVGEDNPPFQITVTIIE